MKLCDAMNIFSCNRDQSLVICRTRSSLLHLHEKNTCWAAVRGQFRDALLYMKEQEVRNSQILTGSKQTVILWKSTSKADAYETAGSIATSPNSTARTDSTQQQELIDRSDVIHRAAMTERPSDELNQSALKGELMLSFRATSGAFWDSVNSFRPEQAISTWVQFTPQRPLPQAPLALQALLPGISTASHRNMSRLNQTTRIVRFQVYPWLCLLHTPANLAVLRFEFGRYAEFSFGYRFATHLGMFVVIVTGTSRFSEQQCRSAFIR